MHKTYKIIVAYDGTDFQGWQVQPEGRPTICATLQDTFKQVFGHQAVILGASRTDSGVHALGQVARVITTDALDATKMLHAWNNALPPSVTIRSLESASPDFHPHTGVVQKTYWYNLFYRRPLPFVARFGWYYRFADSVDWAEFEKALKIYEGEHDFGSFCKVEGDENTVRTIDRITLKKLGSYGSYRVVIQGKGFVRFQIRRMIGYALDVTRRDDLSIDYLRQILQNPNPRQTLVKADASGLVLRRIRYR